MVKAKPITVISYRVNIIYTLVSYYHLLIVVPKISDKN